MGLFGSKEYREAKDDLERVAKRDKTESDDYLKANQRVADTEPRWRRNRR